MENDTKYVGMDVHKDAIVSAVLDGSGRLIMESVIATHAATILDFLHGLRGRVEATFEEGSQSSWLYDLVVGQVSRLVVCNPRKNALMKAGNKSDKIDARKLADLLRTGMLSPVYHGENSPRVLKDVVISYTALTEDTVRVMARLKALYRGQAIACAGKKVWGQR